MNIKGITNLSLVDWDGEVCSTIFVADCNFRCPNCHNAPLVKWPESLKSIDVEDILQDIEGYLHYITGVCITGGEPTLQRYLPEFCRRIKALGLKVKVDTNGKCPMVIQYLIDEKLVDYIAMDIKAPLVEEKYSVAAGTKVYLIELEDLCYSIDLIKKSSIDYEFRTTVVPTIHTPKDVEQICRYAINGTKRYVIQNFWNQGNMIDSNFKKIAPFHQDKLDEFAKIAERYIKEVKIRSIFNRE